MGDLLKTVFELLFRLIPFPAKTGLIKFGKPDRNSPVLVTANYELTVRRVSRVLEGMNCYLLVAQTKGINVWCAAGGGHFTSGEVVSIIKTTEISKLVNHRRIILPQFSSCAIDTNEIKDKTGWEAVFGPAYARDIPRFIRNNFKKTPDISLAKFKLAQRLEMGIGSATALGIVLFIILWFAKRGLIAEVLILNLLLSLLISIFFFKLPGKAGLKKSISLALLSFVLFLPYFYFSFNMGIKGLLSKAMELTILSLIIGVDYPSWTPIWRGNLITGRDSVEVEVDRKKCIGCGMCLSVCPKGSFAINGKSRFLKERGCEGCGSCFLQCPQAAINIVKGKLRQCSCICRPICEKISKPR